jgi:hypothetical protein
MRRGVEMHFVGQRKNAEATTVRIYTMRGDRRAKNPKFVLDTVTMSFEEQLKELGLETVGRWISLASGTGEDLGEVIDIFPAA